MSSVPLKLTRLASLAMSFAFGVIGLGVGINALVKFEDEKRTLKKLVPTGAVLTIDTTDVLSSGIVLTIVCGLIALSSALFLLPALLASSVGGRLLTLQTVVLGFLSVWIFAVLVPFTDFFANRQAKISASIGTIQIPAVTIQQIEKQVGATPVYRDVPYLRLPAVICWFTFLFAVIATLVSFTALRRARNNPYPAYANNSEDHDVVSEKEKEHANVSQQDA